MKVVLSGGEKGTYRNVLLDNKVTRIALNVTQLQIPKRKGLNLAELFKGAEVFIYTSDEDEDVAKFDDFVRTHVDDIEMVIGRPDYNGDWLAEKYVPLWNDDRDLERLAFLCQKYGRVAISDRALNGKTIPRIKQLQQRWGCTLVGLTSKVDNIESIDWDVVIVSSWTSVVRFGETQVWDGHALRRYPAQRKESSRKRHRADIIRLGVDFDAIMEDDVKEVAKLSVRSWQAWGERAFGAYHPSDDESEGTSEEDEMGQIATISPETALPPNQSGRGSAIAISEVEMRGENERVLLPVMGLETAVTVGRHDTSDGDDSYEINPQRDSVVVYRDGNIRQCDSCYLAARCPQFKEHADCAYKLPIELKTKSQKMAALTALLEMQTSRVMFAAFAEQLEGQGMDPGLSKEIDRLFELTEKYKDIEDTRDMVRFEMEAKAGAGVLSRIFGSKVSEAQQQLSTPISQSALDSFIIDADVLSNDDQS